VGAPDICQHRPACRSSGADGSVVPTVSPGEGALALLLRGTAPQHLGRIQRRRERVIAIRFLDVGERLVTPVSAWDRVRFKHVLKGQEHASEDVQCHLDVSPLQLFAVDPGAVDMRLLTGQREFVGITPKPFPSPRRVL
jgi:hypothetical protein